MQFPTFLSGKMKTLCLTLISALGMRLVKTKVQAICIFNYKLWVIGNINFININENTSHYTQSTDVTGRPFFIVLDLQSNSKIIDFPSFLNRILCCVRYFQIITTSTKKYRYLVERNTTKQFYVTLNKLHMPVSFLFFMLQMIDRTLRNI